MSTDSIAVIGAGTMGRGIAEAAASRGIDVVVIETMASQRTAALAHVTKSVEKGIARGKLSAKDPAEIVGRIRWEGELTAAATAAFVVEAASEQEPLKVGIFQELD